MTEMDPNQFLRLLNRIAPGSKLQTVDALNLGFSNRSVRLNAILPDQSTIAYIVKEYSTGEKVFGQSPDQRATAEYKTLTTVHNAGIPCPEPVRFDLTGSTSGSPVLVTKHITGEQIMAHPANPRWAEKAPTVATLLAQIHTTPCPADLITILPNTTQQATWFLENETIPDYMQAYPDGPEIWSILQEKLPQIQSTPPGLTHGDYWSGNILWDADQLTGILDWENAAYGDPGFDIAYCRMEMSIDGMWDAAETFLKTYEAHTGKPVAHLGLCELTVAVQPMWQHAPYLTIPPFQERFRQFVANAKEKLVND